MSDDVFAVTESPSHRPARRLWSPTLVGCVALLPAALWGWRSYSDRSDRPGRLIAEPQSLLVQAESASDRQRNMTILLTNVGGRPLHILDVKTTCGCTQAAPLPSAELQAGEQVPLQLQLQLPSPRSHKQVAVRVWSDAPDESETIIRLTMKGQPLDVPYIEEIRPDFVRATASRPGGLAKSVITVLSYEPTDEEPWIVGIDATIPNVQSQLLDREVARIHDDGTALVVSRYELLTAAPEGGEPELRGTLTPHTQSASTKAVRPVSFRWQMGLPKNGHTKPP